MAGPMAKVRNLVTRYDERVVHAGIDLEVHRGEVLAVVGGSGSGKSTLMREMALLQCPTSGRIELLGHDAYSIRGNELRSLRRRVGVLFQHAALFSDLTVIENVAVPLREHTRLSDLLVEEIAALKIALVGLDPGAGRLYPSQLSGGMIKRAGLARAIALDPELLFLDEPSSGLDPISADAFDDLVLQLKAALGLTIVMVTHDMDSLWRVADRVILIGEGRILGMGTMQELAASENPAIKRFFRSARARAAQQNHGHGQ